MNRSELSGPRGLWEDTKFYGFYTRLRGEDRDLLNLCHIKASRERRVYVSNDTLLRDLMNAYLQRLKAYLP